MCDGLQNEKVYIGLHLLYMRGGVRGCSSTFLFTFGLHDIYTGLTEVDLEGRTEGDRGEKKGQKEDVTRGCNEMGDGSDDRF